MSKIKITGKVLAIQIGREETRIALLGNNNEVLRSVAIETPVGAVEDGMIRNVDAVRGMLRTALKTPGIKRTRQAVFSLCTSQVITDTVTVPEVAGAKLEKLLMANVDMYFPVAMQDYHVAWQIVGAKESDGQKEQLVQMWALPKAMLSPYYTVANACGLSVAAVDYCGHSVANAVGASFARTAKVVKASKRAMRKQSAGAKNQPAGVDGAVATENRFVPETDLHITLERNLVGMTFVQNGQVVLQRFIQCGENPIYQVSELSMMLEYFRSLDVGRGSVIHGILSGSLAWDTQIEEIFTDVLGLSFAKFDGGYDYRFFLCVGAGHTTLDFGVTTFNSPSKARQQVSHHLWQYVLILLGGIVLAGVILLTLSSRLVWNAEINSLQKTHQALAIQAAETNGFADNYNQYKSNYAQYSEDWDTIFFSLKTYNDNLVLVLEELEAIMPEDSSVTDTSDGDGIKVYPWPYYEKAPIAITGLQIAADGLNVQFACESKEEAAYLIMALRELQYADLVAISDLRGGGNGPATSYGTGEHAVEAPPTEGGAISVDDAFVKELIFSQLNEEAMVNLAKNMTDEQFEALEKAYGKQPEATASELSVLKEENKDALTLEMRQNAIHDMLMNNPFAIDCFADLMAEDFKRQEPILWGHIMADIVMLEREGKLDFGTADNVVSVRNQMETLVSVLIKDEPTVTAVEELFCTNDEMEKTYIHYLEVELGLRDEELLPFLNVEKVFMDILTGGFKTEDEALNESLDSMISDDVWDLIDTVTDTERMEELFDKFLEESSTGIDFVDSLIDNFLETGTTGYDMLDQILKEFIDSDSMEDKMTEMLIKYLTEGTSGNEKFDTLIENYLKNGTTGNADLDKTINDFIKSGNLDDILADLLNKYIADGTTGNEVVDGLVEKFLRTGTTGNTVLDEVIKDYLETGKFMDKLEDLLTDYLVEGTTGNKLLDELIGKYMETGSTGNKVLDEMIDAYIDEMLKDMNSNTMAALYLKYKSTGTTGDELYDALLDKYFSTNPHTTGIKRLDEIIQKALNNMLPNGSFEDIEDILGGLFGNSGSTESAAPADTRIFFTATLIYNDELKNAELERKGLDYTEKIDALEVEE